MKLKKCPVFKDNMITLWTGQSDTQRQRRQVSSSTCIEFQMEGRNQRLEILHLPNNRTPPTLMATTIPEISSWGMKLHNLKSFLIFHNRDTQSAGHVNNWAVNNYCWNYYKSKNGSCLFSAQCSRCQLGCSGSQNLPCSIYRRITCSCIYCMEHPKILLYQLLEQNILH